MRSTDDTRGTPPGNLTPNEMANRIYYDRVANEYETKGRINSPENKDRIRRLLTGLLQGSDARVLDICSGAGLYLSILKDLVKPENLYA